ncbi:hypothetical protein PsYK624_127200 [Phanerochaete sordida]|uniref:Cytochrome P450 n=1 Tax=Phanerochaete sordida TaxID=48140 RepID=A0A9P3LIT8_9APHY|nr:hypothetical protein PsYK624_127200 [Phanerochaete sordida]
MVLFPESQLPAQEELDRVLGKARLPSIEDRDALPQITALLYELLRWYPAVPLGVPHRATANIEWDGYRIPSGSTIMANAWAILHDDSIYMDPNKFKPGRYLNADGSLNESVPYPMEAFGYGRRICAGRHFAHDLLWLAIAQLLTIFKIERPIEDTVTAKSVAHD